MNSRGYRLAWVFADLVLVVVTSVAAWYLRYRVQLFVSVEPEFDSNLDPYLLWFFFLAVFFIIIVAFNSGYALQRGKSLVSEIILVGNATLTSIVIIFAVTFGLRPLAYSRLMFLYDAILLCVVLSGARILRRYIESELRRRGQGVRRVLIVGAGEVGRAVMRTMVARPDLGYNVVGFVDDDQVRGTTDIGRFKAFGDLARVEDVLRTQAVDELIITLPWMYQRKISSLLSICEPLGVRPRVVPDLFQFSLSRVDVDDLAGIPLIGIKDNNLSPTAQVAKRLLDVVFTLLIAPLLLVVALVVAVAIKLDSAGPILFTQVRVGKQGKLFKIYKFRSMKVGAEEERELLVDLNEASGPLFKIKDDPRRTRVGKFIRRTSLDELPQFINVLRGEMSVVGPRPPLPEEVAQYAPWQKQRLEVFPGLSGLPQISGRSDLNFDEQCLLDIYYIENWSLALDLTIILRTVPHMLFSRGAY